MIVNQWDKYSKLYNKGIGPTGDKLHKDFIDPLIFKYLENYEGKTIIDVGCGNGYLLNKLSYKAKKIIGIDSSKNLLSFAKLKVSRQKNIETKLADVTKRLFLKTGSFDIIIANMLLQYLPSIDSFAKESFRILKKNGILIVIIDSPLHPLFVRAQNLLGKKDKKLFQMGSYFKREKRRKKTLWDKALLEYYHRPIMDYINSFAKYFNLVRIDENTEDGEMPRILGMKWIKD